MDVSVSSWYDYLGTTVQPVFNTTAMGSITPSQVIFGAAIAYRKAQESFNNGTSVNAGAYLNFASPLLEDLAPSVDNTGVVSKNSTITLRARTVYTPIRSIQPQQSITII